MYERVGAGAVRLCLFFLDSLAVCAAHQFCFVDGQNHSSRAAERGGQCNTQKEKKRIREEGGKKVNPVWSFQAVASKTNWSCAYTAHKTDMTLPLPLLQLFCVNFFVKFFCLVCASNVYLLGVSNIQTSPRW